MLHALEEGQRVRSARASLSGVLTSGPRLRISELVPGLTPPYDPSAIPSYDVHFDNNSRRTVRATELTPLLRLEPEAVAGLSVTPKARPSRARRWATANAVRLVVMIGFFAAVPLVDRWDDWVTKNAVPLGLWIALFGALITAAGPFRRR